MPIKPENKGRYPANWAEIRRVVLQRAGDTCEFCGRPNHVYAYPSGGWFRTREDAERYALPGEKISRIVLTIAHLDHTPENNALDNLRALCQRCHLDWDAPHHAKTAANTRRAKLECAGQLTLDLS